MFSFSDYVRKLARDAALAGIYDALEMIEAQSPHELSQAANLFFEKFGGQPQPSTPAPALTTSKPTPSGASPSTPSNDLLPGDSLESRKRGRPLKPSEGQS